MPMTGNDGIRHILPLFIFLSALLGLVATTTAWAGDDFEITPP
jgi:sorbitol-specific phosphotransferase system component IIBC